MEFVADIAAWGLLLFGTLLFIGQILAYAVGHKLGTWRRTTRGAGDAEGVGLVVSSLVALLAFTLALTLSYSSARIYERRAGALAEATAIGTSFQRAIAIGHPLGQEIGQLLRHYVSSRRDYVLAPRDLAALDDIDRRSSALQSKIWEHLSTIVRERPDDVTASFMESLNATFDATTAERFAFETKFPYQLFWLLCGMILVAVASIGFQFGLKGHDMRWLIALLIGVWTAVLFVIIELSSPRIGAVRTNVAVYDWTIQMMTATPSGVSSSASR
jgi:hypothetical protein